MYSLSSTSRGTLKERLCVYWMSDCGPEHNWDPKLTSFTSMTDENTSTCLLGVCQILKESCVFVPSSINYKNMEVSRLLVRLLPSFPEHSGCLETKFLLLMSVMDRWLIQGVFPPDSRSPWTLVRNNGSHMDGWSFTVWKNYRVARFFTGHLDLYDCSASTDVLTSPAGV